MEARRAEKEGVFLLTPLREGRRKPSTRPSRTPRNFYSRPCGRGDCRWQKHHALRIQISTHAPAGGATFVQLHDFIHISEISTHAPAGGATDPYY